MLSQIQPETQEEVNLVVEMGKAAFQKYGKATPENKKKVQAEIGQALTEKRGRDQSGGQQPSIDGPLQSEYPNVSFSHSTSTEDMMNPALYPNQDRALSNANYDFADGMMPEYNPEIERGMADAKVKGNRDFGWGDVSTLDKVAGGVGAGAAILGAFGVGGKHRNNPLSAISKAGLGYAMGSDDRFYAGKKRELNRDMAPLEAESNIYNAQSKAWVNKENDQLAKNRIGLDASKIGQNERMNFRSGVPRGSGNRSGAEKQPNSLKQEVAWMRDSGQVHPTWRTMFPTLSDQEIMQKSLEISQFLELSGSMNLGGMSIKPGMLDLFGLSEYFDPDGNRINLDDIKTVPTERDIKNAEKELETLRGTQADIVGEEAEGLGSDVIDLSNWPVNSKNYVTSPRDTTFLSDIANRARTGDLMSPKTIEKNWWPDKDTLVENSRLANAADSLSSLDGVSTDSMISLNPEMYDMHPAQKSARKSTLEAMGFGVPNPPPNDGTMTPENYAAFVELWKKDPSIRKRWEEAQR